MQSEHFLRDVLTLGDRHAVVTHSDVFSASRIKLVKGGVRLTSAMYDRLVTHKLLEPIERCVTVAGGVSRQSIAERVRELLAPAGLFSPLTDEVSRGTLVSAFYGIELPARIAFKLTVAREQRPRLFEHSVDAALLAVYIAARRGWDKSNLPLPAAAGLLHDLGELHLDPGLFDPDRILRPDEFEFIYSHPVSAYLIVQAQPEYPAAVREAVLEHHERLDGSGYPRGLVAGAISELGQILAAAEVGAVLLRRAARTGLVANLEVPVKMMWHKFDPQLIGFLGDLINPRRGEMVAPPTGSLDRDRGRLQVIADTLVDWERTTGVGVHGAQAPEGDTLLRFMQVRLEHLHRALMATGFDPRDIDGFVAAVADDGALRGELGAIAREAIWELYDLIHEVQRRWSGFAEAPEASRLAVDGWVQRTVACLAQSAEV